MTQSNLTQEQENQLAQALELTQQFEQKLQKLNKLGNTFAQKWQARLDVQKIPQQSISQEK